MTNIEYNPFHYTTRNPWLLLLALVLIVMAGLLFIGPVLGYLLVLLVHGGGLGSYITIMTSATEYPEYRALVLGVQGLNTLGAFIIAPLIFTYAVLAPASPSVFLRKGIRLNTLFLTVVIVISFMVVNSLVAEWNADVQFPDFMSGLESWAREMEDRLQALTTYLTTFESSGYFVLAIIIIAILPAIGEELLFRGLLQNNFVRITGNVHAAVWIAALLFGLLHFQFYGLVPRVLLGALFGYLYAWSGNLLVPITGHFINNGLSLLLLYLYKTGVTDLDVESTEAFPVPYVIIFAILTLFLLYYFKRESRHA